MRVTRMAATPLRSVKATGSLGIELNRFAEKGSPGGMIFFASILIFGRTGVKMIGAFNMENETSYTSFRLNKELIYSP